MIKINNIIEINISSCVCLCLKEMDKAGSLKGIRANW
jgi:hypothetical protein